MIGPFITGARGDYALIIDSPVPGDLVAVMLTNGQADHCFDWGINYEPESAILGGPLETQVMDAIAAAVA